jgi:hypothetical protein
VLTTLQLHDGMVVRDASSARHPHEVAGEPERLSGAEAVIHFAEAPDCPVVYGVLHRWDLVA